VAGRSGAGMGLTSPGAIHARCVCKPAGARVRCARRCLPSGGRRMTGREGRAREREPGGPKKKGGKKKARSRGAQKQQANRRAQGNGERRVVEQTGGGKAGGAPAPEEPVSEEGDEGEEEEEEEIPLHECAVCLGDLRDGEPEAKLPCNHR
jgi:hypothetical protein